MSERARWEERTVTNEEAIEMSSVLEDLVNSPGWKVYLDLLKGARAAARQEAFSSEKDSFDFFKGLVAGLAAASDLVTDVIGQAREAVRKAESVPTGRRLNLARERDSGDTVV